MQQKKAEQILGLSLKNIRHLRPAAPPRARLGAPCHGEHHLQLALGAGDVLQAVQQHDGHLSSDGPCVGIGRTEVTQPDALTFQVRPRSVPCSEERVCLGERETVPQFLTLRMERVKVMTPVQTCLNGVLFPIKQGFSLSHFSTQPKTVKISRCKLREFPSRNPKRATLRGALVSRACTCSHDARALQWCLEGNQRNLVRSPGKRFGVVHCAWTGETSKLAGLRLVGSEHRPSIGVNWSRVM